jgi:hypothetical protein
MWIILLMLTLAVSFGLFAGTLLFSALEVARFDQLLDMVDKLWPSSPW